MRTPHSTAARRAGFTLIELLVVVAIIALLISILLPSLARAREISKRTSCAANMSGMGRSCLTYAEGNRGSLPAAYANPAGSGMLASASLVGFSRNNPDQKTGLNGVAATTRSYFKLLTGGRRAYMQPKQFLCPSAIASVQHRPQGTEALFLDPTNGNRESNFFDFAGSRTSMANSEMSEFSYSMQVTSKRMLNGELYGISPTNTQDPRKALAADRNPYSNSVTGKNPASGEPLYSAGAGRYEYNPSAVISGFPTAPSFTAANYNTLLRQRPANSRNHKTGWRKIQSSFTTSANE